MMKKILFAALLCLGITANAQQITEKDTPVSYTHLTLPTIA